MERLPTFPSARESMNRRELLAHGIDGVKGIALWQILQQLASADEPMDADEEGERLPLITSLEDWHNTPEVAALIEKIEEIDTGIDQNRTYRNRLPYSRMRVPLVNQAARISWPIIPSLRKAFLGAKHLKYTLIVEEEKRKYFPKRTLAGHVRGDVLQKHLQQDLNVPFQSRSEAVERMLNNLELTLDPHRHRSVAQVLSLLCNEGDLTLGINAPLNEGGSIKKRLVHGLYLAPEMPGESVKYYASGRLGTALHIYGRHLMRRSDHAFAPQVRDLKTGYQCSVCETDLKQISEGTDGRLITISDASDKLRNMKREDICTVMMDQENKTILVRSQDGSWKSYGMSEVNANCTIRSAIFAGSDKPNTSTVTYNTMFW